MADIQRKLKAQKHIALIAHDHKKQAMIGWCKKNKDILGKHFLCGTGTTAKLIAENTGLPVEALKSGPLGGDQEVGARIAEGRIDMVIFFSDPLEAQPHDPDIKALLRIANVYNVPFANNRATADFMIHSEYFNSSYISVSEDYHDMNKQRFDSIQQSIEGAEKAGKAE
jgi:methylglyoxal synthase